MVDPFKSVIERTIAERAATKEKETTQSLNPTPSLDINDPSYVGPQAGNHLLAGYAHEKNTTQNLIDLAATHYDPLAYQVNINDPINGTGVRPPQEVYSPYWDNLTSDEKRQAINKGSENNWLAHFKGVDTTDPLYTTGQVGKYVLDPINATPVGRGVGGAILAGGAIGAIDTASRTKMETGEVNPVQTLVGTVVGATAGGVLEGLVVQPIRSIIEKNALAKKTLAESEVRKEIESRLTGVIDPDVLAKVLDELDTVAVTKYINEASNQDAGKSAGQVEVSKHLDPDLRPVSEQDWEARMEEAHAFNPELVGPPNPRSSDAVFPDEFIDNGPISDRRVEKLPLKEGRRASDGGTETTPDKPAFVGPTRPIGATVGGQDALTFAQDNADYLAMRRGGNPVQGRSTNSRYDALGGKVTPQGKPYVMTPLTREKDLLVRLDDEYAPRVEEAKARLEEIKQRSRAKKEAAAKKQEYDDALERLTQPAKPKPKPTNERTPPLSEAEIGAEQGIIPERVSPSIGAAEMSQKSLSVFPEGSQVPHTKLLDWIEANADDDVVRDILPILRENVTSDISSLVTGDLEKVKALTSSNAASRYANSKGMSRLEMTEGKFPQVFLKPGFNASTAAHELLHAITQQKLLRKYGQESGKKIQELIDMVKHHIRYSDNKLSSEDLFLADAAMKDPDEFLAYFYTSKDFRDVIKKAGPFRKTVGSKQTPSEWQASIRDIERAVKSAERNLTDASTRSVFQKVLDFFADLFIPNRAANRAAVVKGFSDKLDALLAKQADIEADGIGTAGLEHALNKHRNLLLSDKNLAYGDLGYTPEMNQEAGDIASDMLNKNKDLIDYEITAFEESGIPEVIQVANAPKNMPKPSGKRGKAYESLINTVSGDVKFGTDSGDLYFPQLGNPSGKSFSNRNALYKAFTGLFQKPWKRIASYGESGQLAANLFEKVAVTKKHRISRYLLAMDDSFIQNGITRGSPEQQLVRDILRNNVAKGTQIPAKVAKAAQEIRENILNNVIREARKANILTEEQLQKFLENGKTKGYFPRVWDFDYLATKEGRQAFIEKLSGSKNAFTSQEAALSAVQAITGDSESLVRTMIKHLEKQADGTYKMSPRLIDSIYRKIGHSSLVGKSTHLRNARKIPEHLESLLDDFIVKDFDKTMISYLDDTVGDISFSKVFGPKDELFGTLSEGIGYETLDDKAVEYFKEVYFTFAKDPLSKTLRTHYEKDEAVRKLAGQFKAFQTLKLATASIGNSSQVFVNGLTYIAGRPGLSAMERMKVGVTGLFRGMKAALGHVEYNEFILRTGAVYDTVLLQAMGGMNESTHTILGKQLTGIWAPLDYLQNPTKFLTATGFQAIEKFNRGTGALMGQAYLERLIAKRAKLVKLNRQNTSAYQDVIKGLKELGIPDTDDISAEMVEMGAQKISNSINFTGDVHQNPLFGQSFEGRIIMQFKNFITQQTHFVLDHVLAPAKKGNFLPAFVYLGVGTPIGMSLNEFRAFIFADDKKRTQMDKLVRAHMSVGGFGIFFDSIKAASSMPSGLASYAAGPTIGDLSKLAYGATNSIASGNTTAFQKQALQTLGPALKVIPPTREYMANLKADDQKYKGLYH